MALFVVRGLFKGRFYVTSFIVGSPKRRDGLSLDDGFRFKDNTFQGIGRVPLKRDGRDVVRLRFSDFYVILAIYVFRRCLRKTLITFIRKIWQNVGRLRITLLSRCVKVSTVFPKMSGGRRRKSVGLLCVIFNVIPKVLHITIIYFQATDKDKIYLKVINGLLASTSGLL